MANKDYDDCRQHRCLRKYEKIVNQFDELIQMVDARIKPPKPKRRRVTSSPKRSRSKGCAAEKSNSSSCGVKESTSSPAGAASEKEMSGVLVKIITRHLNDLKTDHSSASTPDQN